MDCMYFKFLDCGVHHHYNKTTASPDTQHYPLLLDTEADFCSKIHTVTCCYTLCPGKIRTGSNNRSTKCKENESAFLVCKCHWNQCTDLPTRKWKLKPTLQSLLWHSKWNIYNKRNKIPSTQLVYVLSLICHIKGITLVVLTFYFSYKSNTMRWQT